MLFYFLLSFTIKSEEQLDNNINQINIDNQNKFIEKSKIYEIFNSNIKIQKDINLIENQINEYPQIKDAQVYVQHNGDIDINLTERIPLVRVFDNNNSYYLDTDCKPMQLSSRYTSSNLIINGDLVFYNENEICNLYHHIKSNSFLESLVTQIYLQKQNIILITRFKDLEINIGSLDYIEVKLDNLLAFYERIIKFKGWNYYTSVNLKYHDQIICTKK
jgi:cell division protein FtsQ